MKRFTQRHLWMATFWKRTFNEFLTFGNTECWHILMNFSSNLNFFAQLALHIALQTHVQLTQPLAKLYSAQLRLCDHTTYFRPQRLRKKNSTWATPANQKSIFFDDHLRTFWFWRSVFVLEHGGSDSVRIRTMQRQPRQGYLQIGYAL